MVTVADDSTVETNSNANETITDSRSILSKGEELIILLSSLRLRTDAQSVLVQLFDGDTSEAENLAQVLQLFVNEVHSALLDSSKTCIGSACPLLAHFCVIVFEAVSSPAANSRSAAFCATALLELLPSIVVSAFLYGSTSHSLLETGAAPTVPQFPSGQHVPSLNIPPSPTSAHSHFHFGSVSSPASATLRQRTEPTISSTSPEFLIKFLLWLIVNGPILRLASSFHGQNSPGSVQKPFDKHLSVAVTVSRRPSSASARAISPHSTSPGTSQASVHHFASLVAPSVYHNPVLFGASIISDSAQTEHHQRERRVRIQTAHCVTPVSSLIANFDATASNHAPIQPGMVAPLAEAALAEFNRHHAVHISGDGNVASIVRCSDAALRLLALPVSSPSLQAVSSAVVLQFVYFVNIAAASANRCRSKTVTSHINANAEGNDNFLTDEEQICDLKLLQVLHASRTLAELRLWPDVLTMVKATRNISGLAIDLGEVAEAVTELAFVHPTTMRAITNASFKAKKLADDIEVAADNRKQAANPVSSPSLKRAHAHHTSQSSEQHTESTSSFMASSKRSSHHSSSQFGSHWKSGKHSAAIASLQAAFRLPERLRSRRRSFGHDTGHSLSQSSNHTTSTGNVAAGGSSAAAQRGTPATLQPSASGMTAASFVFGDRANADPLPEGPRLEMRIVDSTSPSTNAISGLDVDSAFEDRHSDLPMIDSANGGPSDERNTPRPRGNSAGHTLTPSSATTAVSRASRP